MLDEEIKEVVKSTYNKLTTLITQFSSFETANKFQDNRLDDQNSRLKDVETKLHEVQLENVRFSGFEKDIKRLAKYVETAVNSIQEVTDKQRRNTFVTDAGTKVFYIAITGVVTSLITWLATGNPK